MIEAEHGHPADLLLTDAELDQPNLDRIFRRRGGPHLQRVEHGHDTSPATPPRSSATDWPARVDESQFEQVL